jgi:Domain of unknown function (DUF6924)
MEMLPETPDSPVIRTDFDSEDAWRAICKGIRSPVPDGFGGEFFAYVAFVENPAFRDLTTAELLERVPNEYRHSFLMVVDRLTMSSPEYPILIVDLFGEPGRSFRAIPAEIQAIENNLSIANMDFAEFADYTDEDGVFRGHPE